MIQPIQLLFITSATITIVSGIWFFRERISDAINLLENKYSSDVVGGIFAPEAEVSVVEDPLEFKNLIKPRADEAAVKVDMISLHMSTVDKIQDEQFSNPEVRHRILLLNPLAESHGSNSGMTGIEAAKKSRFQDNELITQDKFSRQFDWFYEKLQTDGWKNVSIKLYQTTPWIRGVFIDSHYAGFLLTPTIQGGRRSTKFWTEDKNVVDILENNFNDIWNDERTLDFEQWYEENSDNIRL